MFRYSVLPGAHTNCQLPPFFFFSLVTFDGGDGFFIFVNETLMLIDTADWEKGLQSKDEVLSLKGVKRSGNGATKPSSQMTL